MINGNEQFFDDLTFKNRQLNLTEAVKANLIMTIPIGILLITIRREHSPYHSKVSPKKYVFHMSFTRILPV